jgi:HupE / UreJ protein
MLMKYITFYILFLFAFVQVAKAHPMPKSVLLLNVYENTIEAELHLPLKELQSVFPDNNIDTNNIAVINAFGNLLDSYLLKHITISDLNKKLWSVKIITRQLKNGEQEATGQYNDLVYQLLCTPPQGAGVRNFDIHYDVIMHELMTHHLLIKINSDWANGTIANQNNDLEVASLSVNTFDNTIPPIAIRLDEASNWKGFKSMVQLGISHIAEGTDHLLFLFVLLLPSVLISNKKNWGAFSGTKNSVWQIIKLATAFTIGHSLSLIFGATKLIMLPQQPVEIAIAITIFISAIHAIKPIFNGKETWVAMAFGIIHGLAFATVLWELKLSPSKMALSILGFNIGIELMQLFAILCVIPWLILLCKNNHYKLLRILGSTLAIIASLAWCLERITDKSNAVIPFIESLNNNIVWLIMLLICSCIISAVVIKRKEIKIT